MSALPSPVARVAAFVSICVAGAAGGVIGWALVDVQCSGGCRVARGVGTLVGASAVAAGTAIVAVLVLRALGEWRELGDRA
jgi:hypothetical protein